MTITKLKNTLNNLHLDLLVILDLNTVNTVSMIKLESTFQNDLQNGYNSKTSINEQQEQSILDLLDCIKEDKPIETDLNIIYRERTNQYLYLLVELEVMHGVINRQSILALKIKQKPKEIKENIHLMPDIFLGKFPMNTFDFS